jgi:hypothetical protein
LAYGICVQTLGKPHQRLDHKVLVRTMQDQTLSHGKKESGLNRRDGLGKCNALGQLAFDPIAAGYVYAVGQ